jgi:hypothetical protein
MSRDFDHTVVLLKSDLDVMPYLRTLGLARDKHLSILWPFVYYGRKKVSEHWSRQGQPILIGNDIDNELRENCKKFITVPHAVDCLQGELSH